MRSLHAHRVGRCAAEPTRLSSGNLPNCLDDALSIAQRNPELLEIALGQIRENVAVDRILAEKRFIALQSQLSQPGVDCHARARASECS